MPGICVRSVGTVANKIDQPTTACGILYVQSILNVMGVSSRNGAGKRERFKKWHASLRPSSSFFFSFLNIESVRGTDRFCHGIRLESLLRLLGHRQAKLALQQPCTLMC
ncbi:unnamed protein product [Ixodes persulcatus]